MDGWTGTGQMDGRWTYGLEMDEWEMDSWIGDGWITDGWMG